LRREVLDTPLARLCRYYLDCLSHDDLSGVSQSATSSHGDASYVELRALPMFDQDGGDPFDSEAGRRLLGRVRRARTRQTVFLGYPVRLNVMRSRQGREALVTEPLLLLPFEEAASGHGNPTLTDDVPQINYRALRALSNAGDASLLEEAIQLTDDLGLGNSAGEQPDLDELFARLRKVRSDWDWLEEIDPYALSSGLPLSELNQQGIFNRAVLIALPAEGSSHYTKGLEAELRSLQSVEETRYAGTALGVWLNRQTIDSAPADQRPLLEILALNSEQRQAVRQGLSNPLTVITGPPGTGKSQVVTSILVNAARQGQTVLFASKNNKAVDLVETRVNALGPRPVLLRLGANQYHSRLAEYLISLTSTTATAEDHHRLREYEGIHARLGRRSETLDAELQAMVTLRNEVDRLEQEVEQVRHEIGEELFRRLQSMDRQDLMRGVWLLRAAVGRATRARQPFLTRLAWPLVCNARFGRLAEAGRSFQKILEEIGLSCPDVPRVSSLRVGDWNQYGNRLFARASEVAAAAQYFSKLSALAEARSLEELSGQWKKLTAELAESSGLLWQTWLRLQASRMGPEQRKLLGDHGTLLQMINQNRQPRRDVIRRCYQLFPQIRSILSCWAVTSLSARGRVPFAPNFFDVLVIDEASQCDIASALPLLYRARRVVVIGDPMQLRHVSTLSRQQDQQLLGKHGLVDDCSGWAYSARSLFDLADSLCRSEDVVELRDHYRSHADIIEFSNDAFYGGRLRIATNHDRLRSPDPAEPAVRWLDVPGKTVRPAGGGAMNEAEAQAVVEEVERLIGQGYRGSIGVVSPFRAQANRIRDVVHAHTSLVARLADVDFLADTVHRFQGDERDVMIFSPVVSSGVSGAALGFLRNSPNLFNVAISRARAALIVVGDKGAALNCGVDYLARFAVHCGRVRERHEPVALEALGALGAMTRAPDLGPEYPAVVNPEGVSEWERLFYRALYRAGIRPVPQYPVERHRLDFAVLDGARRLGIEIDGERYHRDWDGELCRRCQIRNHRLMELGWDLMRFWVYQVRDDLDRAVDLVRAWAQGGVAGARLRPERPLPDPFEHDEERAVIRSDGFVDDPRFDHAPALRRPEEHVVDAKSRPSARGGRGRVDR
jgi:very-short-patch-repair endonuclease